MSSAELLAAVVSLHTAALVGLIVAVVRTRERIARLEGRLNGERRR